MKDKVLATLAKMRSEVAKGQMPPEALYGLLCDATDYMACDSATAREITRVTMEFLEEISYPNVGGEAPEVFASLLRCCDAEKVVAIGTEFGADAQLWQAVIALVLTDCIENDFAYDTIMHDKINELCSAVGIPVPMWSDSQVCRAVMVEIARHTKSCGATASAALVSDWCEALGVTLVTFVTTAEPMCTDIKTDDDGVEPVAVAYIDDCIAHGITRAQMCAELDSAGLRSNRWVGDDALKKYGEYTLAVHRDGLDGSSFVSVVQIFALTYPNAVHSSTVHDCAVRIYEDGMTVEADDRDLAPYGLNVELLALGMSKEPKKAYLPIEVAILNQNEVEDVFGGDPNYPVDDID